MSEEDQNGQKLAPAPHAGDIRWLSQTVGEPTVSKALKKPSLPDGLDGDAVSPERFVQPEPENISEPKYDAALVTEENDETTPVESSNSDHSTMVVIDLDVSVGINDPEILTDISVTFSGLPTGASLTAGAQNDDNSWVVPATLLDNLSIVITEDTSDFDMVIIMDIGDGSPQSATIHVANDPFADDHGKSFSIRLAPGPELSSVRLYVYLDGGITFDRVLTWPNGFDAPTNFVIPLLNVSLPFEILMRYEVLGDNKEDGPSLVGIDIEDTHVSSGSPAITVQGQINDQGISWQGDLIIDVQSALKSATRVTSETDAMPELLPLVSNDSEPLMAIEPSGPLDNPEQELAIIDVDDTQTAEVPEVESAQDTHADVLIVDASLNDLKSPAFVDELLSLREFIRGKASDSEREIYERLGVDVSKWHDMSVRGPIGAPVDLNPSMPLLAPKGGRDNTRAPQKLHLSRINTEHDVQVRVTGLLPGAFLTHGKNMGDGIWHLTISEADHVSIVPPMDQSKPASLQVSWRVRSNVGHETIAQRSILSNSVLPQLKYANTDIRIMSLRLDADLFDPEGHGALSITVGDMPPGTMLSQGKNHGGGVWTLETTSDTGFQLTACATQSPFSITLTCVALDSETGNSTVASHVVNVDPRKGAMSSNRTIAA